MPQFYLAGDWAGTNQEKLSLTSDQDLTHHLRVRRIQANETFTVFDGRGHTALAKLIKLSNQSAEIEIENIQRDVHREPPYAITLIQGLAGGDKMDWIIEKAVETGASVIVPIECERSILKLKQDLKRLEKRMAHWQAIAKAACEQCDRTVIPTIKALESFQEAIGQSSANQLKILLSPDVKESLDRFVDQTTPQNIQIAIGPEGGFSPEEETFAKQMGYQILSLGPRILRTETAGIVAITAVNTTWNLKRSL